MEDSFRVRVDKTFGSLGNKVSSVSESPLLWSLTDEEIKRCEWKRNKEEEDEDEEPKPSYCPPNKPDTDFRARMEPDLQELSDFEEEFEIDGESKQKSAKTVSDEDWDVQSLIGRDCTLDYEEEEDEYDKVAVCREAAGDRLYMRDAKGVDYRLDGLNTYGELPNTFGEVVRDPRANHIAAKLRLKEDAEAAGDVDSSRFVDKSVAKYVESGDLNQVEHNGHNPKPILKKRGGNIDEKSGKRVRFRLNPECGSENQEEQQSSGSSDLMSESYSSDDGAAPHEAADVSQYSSGVPDYLRNPSKYTRYTFDSSDDVDEHSNQKAYVDFFHQLRNGDTENSLQDNTFADIRKPIIFNPKKKPEDDTTVKKRNESQRDNAKEKSLPIVAAEEDAKDGDVCVMEEDEPCMAMDKRSTSQKPGRQYRLKTNVEEDDN